MQSVDHFWNSCIHGKCKTVRRDCKYVAGGIGQV